ncbi:enoyl-CoA hydratase [Gordonia sp. (in: high G+C Gram-positive bacteria)]|uniref:enoyl-CoA hydratase n=1 Tax=Gordonia sp. (in: high G+C Gram-positive bacteria) TaxID=84139 RepID=UPI0016B79539|nr:enoyl-CoA hydratase [Gordonia sp. (in: high G+C Gram-positive bacteria)]NLG46657.1 enoyl-CoA hydratase [Gordonia sp. (in: high G+C Gram-positive bacteria)]
MSNAVIPPPLGPDDLGPDTSPVAYETAGAVAYVTLNRPEFRNAQNSVMTYSLDAAFRKAVDDADVKVIVLRANGKHFSAGHDIGTPERDFNTYYENTATLHWDHTRADDQPLDSNQRLAREIEVYMGMCRRWREIPKPVIAQVHGACIAGGLMLAWSADFIVASDDAFFSDPVARMGIPGVEYFAHAYVLGARRAKEILFTGQRFTAGQALDWGMVNHVVPREELDAKVTELCAQMTEMPMQGLFLSKKAVNICEDQMGMRNAMDSVFGWHHFAHAANDADSGDSLGGMDARSMRDAAQKDSGQKKGDA